MKRFIDTLKNIWKIKELRDRILFTLGLLWVFRLGSFIVLPGADPEVLQAQMGGGADNSLLGLINVFSGGAFGNASIFALGIMPYITASIIIQLLGFAVSCRRVRFAGHRAPGGMGQFLQRLGQPAKHGCVRQYCAG